MQPDFQEAPSGSYDQVTPVGNAFYLALIAAAMDEEDPQNLQPLGTYRTELDSHANMPVIGRGAYILNNTGKTAYVNPYNPDYSPKEIEIVDAALLYQDQISGDEYILIVRNALHVESMDTNLIPPFIMREAGLIVKETPKIHLDSPTSDDHAIIIGEHLRIPLYLSGTFSYFNTRKPTLEDLETSENIHILTP